MINDLKKPAVYAREFRQIKQSNADLNVINLAYLSSYTSEILEPYIGVELRQFDFFVNNYFAPFNQFEQEVFEKNSLLYKHNPDIIVIHNMLEDMYPSLAVRFSRYSESELEEITYKFLSRYDSIIKAIRKNSNSIIICINSSAINYQSNDLVHSPIMHKKNNFVYELNVKFLSLCSLTSSCHVLDYMSIISQVGLVNWIDQKLYLMAKIPFSQLGQIALGRSIARMVNSVKNQSSKCLVFDLDNTIWSGVIGEDGMSGIQLGDSYPGNSFKNFQREILKLYDQGIFLAVASKNNIDDALEVFRNHSDCLIKEKHLSSIEINWNDKATSIQKISKQLNIGLDAIVFFDDNPVERDLVSTYLPEVKVIDVPENHILYSDALNNSGYFDIISITADDKNRTKMVKQNILRDELKDNSRDLSSFLSNLAIQINVDLVSGINIARVVQLINKTNQFNLTTQRYSEVEIQNLIELGHIVLYLQTSDRFGDSGISGVAIIKNHNDTWQIDSLLLSCRILGKKIETAFLFEIISIVKARGAKRLQGLYKPTLKNSMTSSFYDNHGFNMINKKDNTWEYDLSIVPKNIDYIKVNRIKNDSP